MGTGKHCRWCWWVRVGMGGHGICRHCVCWCARMGMGGHDVDTTCRGGEGRGGEEAAEAGRWLRERVSVSAAVETTGCIPAQHMRCGRESVDGELLIFAKLWAAPARPGARGRRRQNTVAPPGDFFLDLPRPGSFSLSTAHPSGFEQGAVRGGLTAHRSVMLPQNGRGQDGSLHFYLNAGSAVLLFI